MHFLNILADYSVPTIAALTFFAFAAGFIDSVVGGGGLIQLPALLINMPSTPLPDLFGTNKIAGFSGTTVAAYQYTKRVKYDLRLLLTVSAFAFVASNFGVKTLRFIDADVLKPVIFVILVLIALFTFFKKDLGATHAKNLSLRKQLLYGSALGAVVGFYDGFFGPGTGSFFVIGFVVILGFEFLTASAYAKVINCVANFSALIVFIKNGNFIFDVAILMAVGNVSGSIVGSRMALNRGNRFIRIVFLVIVTLMIVKYGYDIFLSDK